MANPDQGEVEIEINGKIYLAKLDLKAHRAIENELGVGSKTVFQELDDARVDYFFTVLWHALARRNPTLKKSDLENWIDDVGIKALIPFLGALIKTSVVWKGLVDKVGNAEPAPLNQTEPEIVTAAKEMTEENQAA